jgi:hypothetical protein
MSDEPLVSVSEAARQIGRAQSTLSRQIASGAIRAHNGKVKLSEVLSDRAANLHPRAKRVATRAAFAEEKLDKQPKDRGGRPSKTGSKSEPVIPTLKDKGIDKKRAARAKAPAGSSVMRLPKQEKRMPKRTSKRSSWNGYGAR